MPDFQHPSSTRSPLSSFTVEVDKISEPKWEAVLNEFTDASIYQTWAYGAICWGEKQVSHLLLKRGSKVVAAAQLRVVRIPLLNCGVAYLRWGPLWRLREEAVEIGVLERMLEALRNEYVDRRGLLLRILPAVFQEDTWAREINACLERRRLVLEGRVRPYHTTRLNVAQPLDIVRKGLNSRWRNYLKTAEKSGYTVRQGTDDELFDQFTVLYREMMARKKFDTTVDIEEFRRIQKRLPETLKMQIFVCSAEGQPQNALVVSAIGDSAIYLHAATGNAGLNGRGAHLLQWRAIEWLHLQGIQWYDTGGINKDKNPGGYQFKSGLGGEEVSHLGRFELRDNWLSATATSISERSQTVVAKARHRVRQITGAGSASS